MENSEKTLGVAGLFTERLNRFLDNLTDEVKQALSHSLQIYTKNWYEKTSKVKTFIYREGSVDFRSIYFPLALIYNKRRVTVPDKVERLFSASNYLTILGHAGSGKTMLMRHCFLSILESRTHMPIIIELRDLNRFNGGLYEYISNFVFNMKLAANEQIMNRLMDSGEFVFFFDGYDELSLDSKEERTKQIGDFVDRFPNNFYMLTSRPDAEAETLTRFENYHISPLSAAQIQAFVHQQMALIPDGAAMEEKMLKAIQTADESIAAYLSNPLLLSMFILTFGYHPTIPSKKTEFYFNVFDTLYTKHDSVTKGGGFAHDKACKLERYQYIKVLQWFCYRTYFKQNYLFSRSLLQAELTDIRERLGYDYDNDKLIYDLTVAISILVQDGLDYIFPHRSMQEYFTAQLIAGLPEQVRIRKVYGNDWFASSVNQNLWSLCEEINGYEFKKNFIAAHLNKLVSTIEKGIKGKKEPAKALLTFLMEKTNIKLFFEESGVLNSVSHHDIECTSVVRYYSHEDLEMMGILIHWIFGYKEDLYQLLATKYGTDKPFPRTIIMKDEAALLMPRLLSEGIHTQIYEQYKQICEVTKKLNEFLDNLDNNNEKLLDL